MGDYIPSCFRYSNHVDLINLVLEVFMAVRALPQKNVITVRHAVEQKSAKLVTGHRPRRCMVVSTGVLLSGFGIPLLMAIGVLPMSLLLGLFGLFLMGLGGVMLLIFCGEI